jgi:hypothetical protein
MILNAFGVVSIKESCMPTTSKPGLIIPTYALMFQMAKPYVKHATAIIMA